MDGIAFPVLDGDWTARVEKIIEGCTPIIFTAPHTLLLHRDDNEHHKQEDYTGYLARSFSKITQGMCVTWTDRERARIKENGEPDALNRDPNYLLDEELPYSPWLVRMKECLAFLDRKIGPAVTEEARHIRLLIDVHGMSDRHESDCVIGTAAVATANGSERQAALHDALSRSLNSVLCRAGLQPVQFNSTSSGTSFSGQWHPSTCRNTLSQMAANATLFEPIIHASRIPVLTPIQMELSHRFRKRLAAEPELRVQFARAFLEMI
jgi:hypothetical protein